MTLTRLNDTERNYGWISIISHWITAAAVFALWLAGDSIGAYGGRNFDRNLRTHTTIALAMYIFLVARVVWRFRSGHPKRLTNQGKVAFALGKYTHFLMLYCILIMIVTGPLMAWAGALPLSLFDVTLPAPFGPNVKMFDSLHRLHALTASVLIIAALLHVCGVFLHMMIPKDGTFDKMMTPGRRDASSAAPKRPADGEVISSHRNDSFHQ